MPEGFRQALYRSVHSHFALRGIGQLRPFAAAEASRAGIDDTSFSPVSRYRSRSVAAENVPAQMLGSVTLGLDAFCYVTPEQAHQRFGWDRAIKAGAVG